MPVQDDTREIELINLFDLEDGGEGRSGTDAYLEVGGESVEFELKSVTRGGVTTVRDFGPDHIRKWRTRHWLIGVYDRQGATLRTCWYGSPAHMDEWITEKADYIAPDFELATISARHLNLADLYQICGQKERYGLDDARALHKRQYSMDTYRSKMDLRNGYSPAQMLEILRDRQTYLMSRGSTLNNPHIPMKYVKDNCQQIDPDGDPAERLREFVRRALI